MMEPDLVEARGLVHVAAGVGLLVADGMAGAAILTLDQRTAGPFERGERLSACGDPYILAIGPQRRVEQQAARHQRPTQDHGRHGTVEERALAAAIEEWQQNEYQDKSHRHANRRHTLEASRYQFEQLEERQEVPLRQGDVGGIARIRRGLETRTDKVGEKEEYQDDQRGYDHVLGDHVRPEPGIGGLGLGIA